MLKRLGILLVLFGVLLSLSDPASGARIKDIAKISGVRGNQLYGYGLIIGLNGTGDKQGTEFTIQSLANMLQKIGIRVNADQVKVKNVAAVMVTAELPAFTRPGMRLDAMVSSIGDAKSLQGGTLLLTSLMGVDGNVYALAQGAVSIGGFSVGAGGSSAQKNHPTVGLVPNGVLVEKGVEVPLLVRNRLDFVLHRSDFTTAELMAQAMNRKVGAVVAQAMDSRTVTVTVPAQYQDRLVDYITKLETVEVGVDTPARIVFNERTGTVVMGENVRISTVAVSHGGLSVVISEDPLISQPTPLSLGRTVVEQQQEISVKEEESRLMVLPQGTSLGDVVKALNAVGVTSLDLIAILEAIQNAGALNGELVIM